MTGGFERRNHGRGHSYWLDGHKLDGVTTVLGNALRARALEDWSARITAETAVNRWDELDALPVADRLRILSRARYESRDAAALTGTEVHALAWALVTGEPVDVPDRHVGAVQALARFMDAWGVDPVQRERPVVHPAHGWAGTFDLLCGIRGTLWLLDWKTGRGVYPEVSLQLAAYAHAAQVQDEAGNLTDWIPPERCGAVHITADSAELLPIDWSTTDDAYTVFRYCQQVHRWTERVSAAREAGEPWPVGPALHPSAPASVPA